MRHRQLLSAAMCTLMLFSSAPVLAQNASVDVQAEGRVMADIPEGAWYESAVQTFLEAGYLDRSQTQFRPNDPATRAEVVKLLIEPNGGVQGTLPSRSNFDDVSMTAWFFGYFEEGAKRGWVKGDRDCYGTHPCSARPLASINRAEAATLIVRVFALAQTDSAPGFADSPAGAWYAASVQAAADHCVLRGDDATGRVRPADRVNRAEIISMIARALENLSYERDSGQCERDEELTGKIQSVEHTGGRTVEVTFDVDVDDNTDEPSAEDVRRYALTGDGSPSVVSAALTDDRSVVLTLNRDLRSGETYTLSVRDLRTADGKLLTDGDTFTAGVQTGQPGQLRVSLAPSSASGSLVAGAQGASLFGLRLTAPCDRAVTLSRLTLHQSGTGSANIVGTITASVGGTAVTQAQSVDALGNVTLRFSPVLTIPACQTVELALMGDVSANARVGDVRIFSVDAAGDFQTTATSVTGSFPIRSVQRRIGSASSAGTVALEYAAISPSTIRAGSTGAVLGRFRLSADNSENQILSSLRLRQSGTVSGALLTNLRLRGSGGVLVTGVSTAASGGLLQFAFSPAFTLRAGQSVLLDVVGTLGGGTGSTVRFDLPTTAEFTAAGAATGRSPTLTFRSSSPSTLTITPQ